MTIEAGVSFRELLAYTDYLAVRWMAYFAQNPAALDINIGGKTGTIRVLVDHIFQVEHFFANRLLRKDSSSKPESSTPEELLRLHQTSYKQLLNYMASVDDEELNRTQTVGPTTASNRKILTQAMLHSVHHWAQVAMEVRQAGFPTQKPQDIIITDVMK
jgi:uncharacterized damage-inducible protein DinB